MTAFCPPPTPAARAAPAAAPGASGPGPGVKAPHPRHGAAARPGAGSAASGGKWAPREGQAGREQRSHLAQRRAGGAAPSSPSSPPGPGRALLSAAPCQQRDAARAPAPRGLSPVLPSPGPAAGPLARAAERHPGPRGRRLPSLRPCPRPAALPDWKFPLTLRRRNGRAGEPGRGGRQRAAAGGRLVPEARAASRPHSPRRERPQRCAGQVRGGGRRSTPTGPKKAPKGEICTEERKPTDVVHLAVSFFVKGSLLIICHLKTARAGSIGYAASCGFALPLAEQMSRPVNCCKMATSLTTNLISQC